MSDEEEGGPGFFACVGICTVLFIVSCFIYAAFHGEDDDEKPRHVIGKPAIRNQWERRQYKMIYEQRDKATPTITYVRGRDDELHKLCTSVGYGIPASTKYNAGSDIEPNDLSVPKSGGMWIMCLHNHRTRATYVGEPVDIEAR